MCVAYVVLLRIYDVYGMVLSYMHAVVYMICIWDMCGVYCVICDVCGI